MAAAQTRTALTADGVDLVDEDDGWRRLLGLVEQIPDAAGADAHVQLYEIRAGNGEELHPRLPGHGLGQQGLAGARRAHQEHALGDARAQLHEAFGILQELHDFPELLLFLVLPRHVGEGDFLIPGPHSGPGPAETHGGFIAARAAPVHHYEPEDAEHHQNDQIGDEGQIPGSLPTRFQIVILQDAFAPLLIDELMEILIEDGEAVQLMDDVVSTVVGLLQRQDQGIAFQHEGADLIVPEQIPHLGIGHLCRVRIPVGAHQKNHGDEYHQYQDIEPDISRPSFPLVQIRFPPSAPVSSSAKCRMLTSGSCRYCWA